MEDTKEYSVECQLCRESILTKIIDGNLTNWKNGELHERCFADIPHYHRNALINPECGSCLIELSDKINNLNKEK